MGERMTYIMCIWILSLFACACRRVVAYLPLIHGVVTYVHNWSRVSLGGPYDRDKERDIHVFLFKLWCSTQTLKQGHRRILLSSQSDLWRALRGETSIFEPMSGIQGGQICQSPQGSKSLFKDISSVKVVMDGPVGPGSPQWLCVCLRPLMCVRPFICMSAKTAQNARLPPPLFLTSVIYPLDSRMPNLLSLRATWRQNWPSLPILKEMMHRAREGHSWKRGTVRAWNINANTRAQGQVAPKREGRWGAATK